MPEPADLWHAPRPGPLYWDWRCMACGEPVEDHPSWWARAIRRIFLRISKKMI